MCSKRRDKNSAENRKIFRIQKRAKVLSIEAKMNGQLTKEQNHFD